MRIQAPTLNLAWLNVRSTRTICTLHFVVSYCGRSNEKHIQYNALVHHHAIFNVSNRHDYSKINDVGHQEVHVEGNVLNYDGKTVFGVLSYLKRLRVFTSVAYARERIGRPIER